MKSETYQMLKKLYMFLDDFEKDPPNTLALKEKITLILSDPNHFDEKASIDIIKKLIRYKINNFDKFIKYTYKKMGIDDYNFIEQIIDENTEYDTSDTLIIKCKL